MSIIDGGGKVEAVRAGKEREQGGLGVKEDDESEERGLARNIEYASQVWRENALSPRWMHRWTGLVFGYVLVYDTWHG